jgi:predicted amino acid-binding ACT domain protein
MSITIRSITLWRTQTADRPGLLAGVLAPFAEGGNDLRIVMGYHVPGPEGRTAVLELFPVSGKKAETSATAVGLATSSIPTLLVEGDDRAGLGHELARGVADAGVDIHFLVAQVIGRKFSAVFGFGGEEDARKAAAAMKKAAREKGRRLSPKRRR